MISTTLLFDIAPVGGGLGAILGLAFFFIFAAVAFIAYKMLKKTVKMAVRMTIVVAILLIALVGSVALLLFSSSSGGTRPARPASTTQKPTK
jgi:EamA domain-containing membrane protein RarD